jgi:hypothetical protein
VEVYRQHLNFVTNLLRGQPAMRDGMRELIMYCSLRDRRMLWSGLMMLDFEQELDWLYVWLKNVLEATPPSDDISAFWFGLAEEVGDNDGTCRLYISGSPYYDPEDESDDWEIWGKDSYLPPGRVVDSSVLRILYRSISLDGEPGATISQEFPCLVYAGLAIIWLCKSIPAELMIGHRNWRAIAVGWESGDTIMLGRVSKTGWQALPSKEQG